MPMSSRLRALFTLAAFVLATGTAAHDAWIEPHADGYVVVYGHGDKRESYAPAKVKSVAALDVTGAALPANVAAGADGVRFAVAGQPALLTLHFDNGVWTKTADGSRNLPKNEVPGALSASHSVKFGKAVLIWGESVARPHGQQLEILPLAAAAPKAGDMLAVQVLWEGKPLPGAKITGNEYGKENTIESDAAGKARVPVVAGRQMLVAHHRRNLTGDPRADVLSVSANLVFEAR